MEGIFPKIYEENKIKKKVGKESKATIINFQLPKKVACLWKLGFLF